MDVKIPLFECFFPLNETITRLELNDCTISSTTQIVVVIGCFPQLEYLAISGHQTRSHHDTELRVVGNRLKVPPLLSTLRIVWNNFAAILLNWLVISPPPLRSLSIGSDVDNGGFEVDVEVVIRVMETFGGHLEHVTLDFTSYTANEFSEFEGSSRFLLKIYLINYSFSDQRGCEPSTAAVAFNTSFCTILRRRKARLSMDRNCDKEALIYLFTGT